MIILTGYDGEINVLKVIVLADTPDFKCVAQLVPVEAKQSSFGVL